MRYLLSLLVVVAALALQSTPIPPYPGDGNSQHDGQPMWCQNSETGGFKANCSCVDKADVACDKTHKDSSKCKVWCRKSSCHCLTMCDHQTR